MKVSYEAHSLLYGLSCMWLVVQIFTPYLIWPNFAKTESEHLLKSRPKLINYMDSFGRRTGAIRWMPRLIMLIMVSLTVVILYLSNFVQSIFLTLIGVQDTTKLSYKVLIYMPTCIVSYDMLMISYDFLISEFLSDSPINHFTSCSENHGHSSCIFFMQEYFSSSHRCWKFAFLESF